MKDIDFDELDRAVSSIIGDDKNTKTSASSSAPAPAPVIKPAYVSPQPTAASGPATPARDVADVTPRSPRITGVAATAPRSPSPASRRGGRFMDVVHPSSDMKQAVPTPAPAPPRKPVISPIHNDVVPTPALHAPAVASVEIEAATSDQPQRIPEVTATPAQKTSVWPDPLDLVSSGQKTAQAAEADDAPGDDDASKLVEAAQPEAGSPLTPFLSDTKVEKRPLGAFADGHSEPPSYTEVAEHEAAEAVKKEQDSQLEPEVILPPEYQPDLVAIEAKEQVAIGGEEPAPKREPAPQPVPETKQETSAESPQPESTPAEKPAVADAISSPIGGSIPPQYHAADAPADIDELHAVFDTEVYHQPLLPSKTHRRTPVWAWALLAIGLLAVGGGIGALLFILGY